jgi:hypothetical protein
MWLRDILNEAPGSKMKIVDYIDNGDNIDYGDNIDKREKSWSNR